MPFRVDLQQMDLGEAVFLDEIVENHTRHVDSGGVPSMQVANDSRVEGSMVGAWPVGMIVRVTMPACWPQAA